MMNFFKEHPYLSAGGVFVVGAVLVVILFSGDSASAGNSYAAPDNSSAVAASTALQMAQLEGQTQIALGGQQAGVAMAGIAAQLEAAKLENARGSKADDLSAAVAQAQITSNAETQKLMSTLAANVQLASLETQETVMQIQANATTALATLQKQQMVELAEISASNNATLASMMTQAQITQGQQYKDMIIGVQILENQKDLGLADLANQRAADEAHKLAEQRKAKAAVDAATRARLQTQINTYSAQFRAEKDPARRAILQERVNTMRTQLNANRNQYGIAVYEPN